MKPARLCFTDTARFLGTLRGATFFDGCNRSAIGGSVSMLMVSYRVRTRGPMSRLELYAGKLARTVLRGQGGSNASLLPDQALETKAKFIAQVMTGENAARRAEDIGGQELSYAEVKAIASGNPAVLTLAEADAEL